MSQTTYTARPGTLESRWYLVDARGQTLGRLAVNIARVLRGKPPDLQAHEAAEARRMNLPSNRRQRRPTSGGGAYVRARRAARSSVLSASVQSDAAGVGYERSDEDATGRRPRWEGKICSSA